MEIDRYLNRILFDDNVALTDQTFINLHVRHVFQVPFENLDIRYHRVFDLSPDHLYQKVVDHQRGGFCYELNYLFSQLLNALGFSSTIIASRIFDTEGKLGPAYDHMSVYVKADKEYLADVGFGDLFVRPLAIKAGVQYDGRHWFQIEKQSSREYLLSMSSDGIHFQKKYIFNLTAVPVHNFDEICLHKQTHPASYFVKNTICTRPTPTGRITILNDTLIEKNGSERRETLITDDQHLRAQLMTHFGIVIS